MSIAIQGKDFEKGQKRLSNERFTVWSVETLVKVEDKTCRTERVRGGRVPRCRRRSGTYVRPASGLGRASFRPGVVPGTLKKGGNSN